MQWEIFVDAAEACNKMVFECANSTFSSIATMNSWWNKLEVDSLIMHKILEHGGAFIVKSLELGTNSSCAQFCM
jgi:hypothetical protein